MAKNEIFTTDWQGRKVIAHQPEIIKNELYAIPKNYIGKPQALRSCQKLNEQGINCHPMITGRGYYLIVIDE